MEAGHLDMMAAAERRTYRANFGDGIDDLFGGLLFLLLAVAFLAPDGRRAPVWAAFAVSCFVLVLAKRAIKHRLATQRGGFVGTPLTLFRLWATKQFAAFFAA